MPKGLSPASPGSRFIADHSTTRTQTTFSSNDVSFFHDSNALNSFLLVLNVSGIGWPGVQRLLTPFLYDDGNNW